jgi:ribonuclease P protein component
MLRRGDKTTGRSQTGAASNKTRLPKAKGRFAALTWPPQFPISPANPPDAPFMDADWPLSCALIEQRNRARRGLNYETYLPAKPARSLPPSRLPCPHGNQGRPQDPERAPCAWPQEALGLRLLGGLCAMPDHPAKGQGTHLRRLTKRSQFLRAARGNRAGRPAFALQAIASDAAEPGIGFTVTKKVGNSPERNRIKRRMREAVRARADDFSPQHDYVLVGRREALTEPFAKLVSELGVLIDKVHTNKAHTGKGGSLRNTRQ